MPVQLAVEMKNKMMERHLSYENDGPNKPVEKKTPYGKFHDLFIRTHDNVRYIELKQHSF
jgi:hypothetical protein